MIGVDEVGRGCLAGPLLVVAAQASGELPSKLKDSKLLSRQQRALLLNKLSDCCKWGEGWVSCTEIDRLGLSRALRLGAARALKQLGAKLEDEIILDGKFNYIPNRFVNSCAIVKADNLVPVVSAAGVIAKVKRDNYMIKLSEKHPIYKFENHVGYGTKAHMLALKEYGALKYVHRRSFAPVASLSGDIL